MEGRTPHEHAPKQSDFNGNVSRGRVPGTAIPSDMEVFSSSEEEEEHRGLACHCLEHSDGCEFADRACSGGRAKRDLELRA